MTRHAFTFAAPAMSEKRDTPIHIAGTALTQRCAVCHQEHCRHADLEYAGIVPAREAR